MIRFAMEAHLELKDKKRRKTLIIYSTRQVGKTWLLSCMVGLRQDVILDGNDLFKEFKGALAEQYVLQQLKTLHGISVYYWTAERGTDEVGFVIDTGSDVIPVEVKAEKTSKPKA